MNHSFSLETFSKKKKKKEKGNVFVFIRKYFQSHWHVENEIKIKL